MGCFVFHRSVCLSDCSCFIITPILVSTSLKRSHFYVRRTGGRELQSRFFCPLKLATKTFFIFKGKTCTKFVDPLPSSFFPFSAKGKCLRVHLASVFKRTRGVAATYVFIFSVLCVPLSSFRLLSHLEICPVHLIKNAIL